MSEKTELLNFIYKKCQHGRDGNANGDRNGNPAGSAGGIEQLPDGLSRRGRGG